MSIYKGGSHAGSNIVIGDMQRNITAGRVTC